MDKEKINPKVSYEEVISAIEALSEDYRLDTEMPSDRARLYMGWLDETAETVKELSPNWNPALKTAFAQTTGNLLNSRYFRFGTEYGTGYGARPLVEISRSLKYFSYLPEEEAITYLKLLEKIYISPQLRLGIRDPLYFFDSSGSETDTQFVHPLVKELNRRLEKATDFSPIRKKEMAIVSSFVDLTRKAVATNKEILGFIFLNGSQILEWLGIPYKNSSSQTGEMVLSRDFENDSFPLDRLPSQVRENLLSTLQTKAEAARDNYSDYEKPGLSNTMLNNELESIWREIELIFYQTLANNL